MTHGIHRFSPVTRSVGAFLRTGEIVVTPDGLRM